jgi:N-carbamoylputrescine amidase
MGRVNLHTAFGPRESPARVDAPARGMFRVAAVQTCRHEHPEKHRASLDEAVCIAADLDAKIVCLPELTLSPYFAMTADDAGPSGRRPEPLPAGQTHLLAADLAARYGIVVHASLYEEAGLHDQPAPDGGPALGFNTAIAVDADGALLARTRKSHIPVTAGYVEDRYFRQGDTGFPITDVGRARLGFPTCWDEWFPELARCYALSGADILVYPTAIGSEPDHPDFDTQPLWQQVIVGNGIANGLNMVVPNRTGLETVGDTSIRFYGSSFISDPYGRILVQANRDETALLVADIDLDARHDWLRLFPFLETRRPETYGPLVT